MFQRMSPSVCVPEWPQWSPKPTHMTQTSPLLCHMTMRRLSVPCSLTWPILTGELSNFLSGALHLLSPPHSLHESPLKRKLLLILATLFWLLLTKYLFFAWLNAPPASSPSTKYYHILAGYAYVICVLKTNRLESWLPHLLLSDWHKFLHLF